MYGAAFRAQRTLKNIVSYSGIGLHTGNPVNIRFCPSSENSGIFFKRVDLPDQPLIPADVEYVHDTSRSTSLKVQDVSIHTVEHLLAALKAYHIDNLKIEIDSSEVPIGDGSSLPFVHLIEKAGIQELSARRPIYSIASPIYWSSKQVHLVALPSEEFRLSYTLHYPNTPLIRSQYYSLPLSSNSFKAELSACRTFALYEEIAYLQNQGLLRGGSLETGIVIEHDHVLNPEGLRFNDEMVRHKILDLVGDLSLLNLDFKGHVIAICSGHFSNVAFGRELWHYFKNNLVE